VFVESGALRADQIDPFGASDSHDDKTDNFKVVSAQQTGGTSLDWQAVSAGFAEMIRASNYSEGVQLALKLGG
jgi:hypothetical protein